MTDYEKAVAELDGTIARRKAALAKLKAGGDRPAIVDERRLRRLVKQVQRRKAKLLKDRKRRSGMQGEAEKTA